MQKWSDLTLSSAVVKDMLNMRPNTTCKTEFEISAPPSSSLLGIPLYKTIKEGHSD